MKKSIKTLLISIISIIFLSLSVFMYLEYFHTYKEYSDIPVPVNSEHSIALFDFVKFGPVDKCDYDIYKDIKLYICNIEIDDITPVYVDKNLVKITFQVDDYIAFKILLDEKYYTYEERSGRTTYGHINWYVKYNMYFATTFVYSNDKYVSHVYRTKEYKEELKKEKRKTIILESCDEKL